MNRLKKHNLEKIPKAGDKVKWTYTHHLNSRSSKRITKTGIYLREIVSEKVDGGSRITGSTHCFVHFEGNKNPSRVLKADVIKCGVTAPRSEE